MVSRLFSRFPGALAALCLIAAPAAGQEPRPPEVPLWTMTANGDAVQTDLGFILPPRIGRFERRGFTSTRPDGGSVMTWYESPDGTIGLRILLQLRADVRGVPLPGADALERNWRLLQMMAGLEHGGRFDEVSLERVSWGRGQPVNALRQWLRYPLDDGALLRGTWYRNIGLWAVVVIATGPEDRRNEIEAAAEAAIAIPWPAAPLTADLRAIAAEFVRSLPACPDFPREGAGRPVEPRTELTTVVGMALLGNFLEVDDNPRLVFPHPVLDPRPYCRIEAFRAAGKEILALGWRGDASAEGAARYAFLPADGGHFLQVESLFGNDALAPEDRREIRRLVWMTMGDDRRVSALQAFDDWPSYERARALAEAAFAAPQPTIASVTSRAGSTDVAVAPGRD